MKKTNIGCFIFILVTSTLGPNYTFILIPLEQTGCLYAILVVFRKYFFSLPMALHITCKCLASVIETEVLTWDVYSSMARSGLPNSGLGSDEVKAGTAADQRILGIAE